MAGWAEAAQQGSCSFPFQTGLSTLPSTPCTRALELLPPRVLQIVLLALVTAAAGVLAALLLPELGSFYLLP